MRSTRRTAVLVVALGVVVTVAGLVSTVRSTLEWQESARIAEGPRVLATVVSTGEVVDNHQEVTLRYEDAEGRTHALGVSYPLGLADYVIPGETTSVTYDPGSPDRAQLEGHPQRGLHDVALAGGLTLLATAVWLGWSAVLRGAARTAQRQASDATAETGIITTEPLWGPSDLGEGYVTAAPTSPRAASGSHVVGTGAAIASLLTLLGTIALSFGTTGRQEAAFPPLPPDAAPRTEPVELPGILSAPPPLSGPLLTPEKAQGVFEAAWRVRDEALVRHDVATIRALETGPALEVDLARMEEGGTPNRPDPGPDDLRWSTTYVPRQTTWPVYFLGEAVTTSVGEPFLELMIFERTGPDVAWQIVFNTGVPEGNGYTAQLQPPILDDEGYNVVPATTWMAPGDVVPALAEFWTSWLERGEPPTVGPSFAAGYWTTDYGLRHAGKQDTVDLNGLPSHYIYNKVAPGEGELWTFGVYGDKLMVCSPMRDEVTWTGPAHQDEQRRKWGRDLAPGVYASVTGDSVRQPCVFVPPQPGPLEVFGADRRGTALRGVLAKGLN